MNIRWKHIKKLKLKNLATNRNNKKTSYKQSNLRGKIQNIVNIIWAKMQINEILGEGNIKTLKHLYISPDVFRMFGTWCCKI